LARRKTSVLGIWPSISLFYCCYCFTSMLKQSH
jgi:hypothetical protein